MILGLYLKANLLLGQFLFANSGYIMTIKLYHLAFRNNAAISEKKVSEGSFLKSHYRSISSSEDNRHSSVIKLTELLDFVNGVERILYNQCIKIPEK